MLRSGTTSVGRLSLLWVGSTGKWGKERNLSFFFHKKFRIKGRGSLRLKTL
jgi:hypothetical protein